MGCTRHKIKIVMDDEIKQTQRMKSISIYNILLLSLFLLSVLALFQTCFTLSPITQNLLLGLLVSAIFYFLVVFVPTYIRKENLKTVFLNFYDQFKEDVLREVLHLMEFDGDEYEKIEELKNTDEFIAFAQDASQTEGQTNWHVLMNNIDEEDHKHSLRTIAVKLSELQREADFLIRTAGVEDN